MCQALCEALKGRDKDEEQRRVAAHPPAPGCRPWMTRSYMLLCFISSPTTYRTEQGGDTPCVLQREELKSLGVAFPVWRGKLLRAVIENQVAILLLH